jgi:hypothetical protein
VIEKEMLLRAWLILGIISAVLVPLGHFAVLLLAGWSPATRSASARRSIPTTSGRSR